jgi:hypothetical protein
MTTARPTRDATPPTPPDTLAAGEELVAVRAGPWRMLVPLRHVERVFGAAMPAARPATPSAAPVVAIGEALVPVVFAAALVGATDVSLAPEHQMVLLGAGGARAVLWVDAVEDVVEHVAAASPPREGPDALVAAWSGADRPLAVLDVPRLVSLVA